MKLYSITYGPSSPEKLDVKVPNGISHSGCITVVLTIRLHTLGIPLHSQVES